jgi:hypothetical protein
MLRSMGDKGSLSGDQWEALLHLPFAAYSGVLDVERGGAEAQFRAFRDEIDHGRTAFAEGTTGADLASAVASNLDILWSAYQAAGRSPEDVAKRGMKVLRRLPEDESVAIRDWLLGVALRVAGSTRTVGQPAVSWSEVFALRDLARWLKRPVPDITQG